METIDIIIAIPLLFGLVRGLMRGFIIEIASLVALILGVFGAIHFSFYAEDLLKENADLEGNTLSLAAFALTFIAIVIAIHLGARFLQKILQMAALGIVNRIAGGVFGLVKWVLMLSYILVFLNGMGGGNLNLISDEAKSKSILYGPIVQAGPTILPMITESSWYEDLDIEIPDIENIE